MARLKTSPRIFEEDAEDPSGRSRIGEAQMEGGHARKRNKHVGSSMGTSTTQPVRITPKPAGQQRHPNSDDDSCSPFDPRIDQRIRPGVPAWFFGVVKNLE